MVGFLHSGIRLYWEDDQRADGGVRRWGQTAEEASFMWVDGSRQWLASFLYSFFIEVSDSLISLATTNTNIILNFFCWLLKRMYLPMLRSLFSLLTFAICLTSIWLAGAGGQLGPVHWVASEVSARHCQLCPNKTTTETAGGGPLSSVTSSLSVVSNQDARVMISYN